eukprot:tig00000246_g21514.t1
MGLEIGPEHVYVPFVGIRIPRARWNGKPLGPGVGVGIGCGVGVGVGLSGGIGIGLGSMPGLHFGAAVGGACGIGAGFGYGLGLPMSVFGFKSPASKPAGGEAKKGLFSDLSQEELRKTIRDPSREAERGRR